MKIEIEPIGYVREARQEAVDDNWGGAESHIELADTYPSDALQGLEGFSHVEVLFHFDRAALTRMRARQAGLDPDAALAREGGPGARWHRRGRRIKGWVDRLRGKA